MTLAILAPLLLSLSVGPQPPAGWTDGYVMANGIRIHYWRTGGNKPPLVLAHGSSDDGLCWTNLAKEFQNDFDIIMFDARGPRLARPPARFCAPRRSGRGPRRSEKSAKTEQADSDGALDGQRIGRSV